MQQPPSTSTLPWLSDSVLRYTRDDPADDAASFYSTSTDPLSSPTDGYFANPGRSERRSGGSSSRSGTVYGTSGRYVPADEMYIDTEAANKGAKPKVTVSSSSPVAYREEQTPLLDAFVGQEAPPPSYLEATTPLGWHVRPSGDEAERLLEDGNGRRPPFTPLREEVHKDGKYRRRSLAEHCTKKKMLKWMAAILAVVILAVIIAAAMHQNNKNTVVSPIPSPAEPAESGAPDSKENFPIRWPSQCGKQYNVRSEDLGFSKTPDLKIVEAVHQLDGPYKRVAGWIHVAQAAAGQAPGTIDAKLSYAASSSIDIDSIKYSYTPNSLTIGDPSFPDGFDGLHKGDACLGISIVLYMAAGATLENFNIQATHLGMQIHQGANFSVTGQTSISLTTGTLDSVSFSSRETRLETISGSISGKYSLMDLLSVKTKSGSVNINVEPKEKAKNGSPVARFMADTMSGSMRVDFERKRIPDRDYVVDINSTVGSVDGTFIHGSKTDIKSVAGSINVDLLPFSTGDSESLLTTSTTDGQTIINMRSPYNGGTALSKLVSNHSSVSGQLNITYPQEWEGHLEGQSMTGKLHLQGKDLELIQQVERPGFSMVEAKKGNGKSTMVFKTVVGAVNIKVGKLQ